MTQPSVSLSRSSSILLELLARLLAPLFLSVTGGDICIAHMAARATINDFQAASKADLIAVAQIVAFGLGSLAAIVASISGDTPVSTMLSLQRTALACDRAAERSRKSMGKYGRGFAAEAADAAAYAAAAAEPAEAPVTETGAQSEHCAHPIAQLIEQRATAEPESDESSNEPPLFPSADIARMLQDEAEARLRHPATGPATELPPDLFPRPAATLRPSGNPPLPPGTAANALKLPSVYEADRRPHSVRAAALGTTAATRLTGPDIPFKR